MRSSALEVLASRVVSADQREAGVRVGLVQRVEDRAPGLEARIQGGLARAGEHDRDRLAFERRGFEVEAQRLVRQVAEPAGAGDRPAFAGDRGARRSRRSSRASLRTPRAGNPDGGGGRRAPSPTRAGGSRDVGRSLRTVRGTGGRRRRRARRTGTGPRARSPSRRSARRRARVPDRRRGGRARSAAPRPRARPAARRRSSRARALAPAPPPAVYSIGTVTSASLASAREPFERDPLVVTGPRLSLRYATLDGRAAAVRARGRPGGDALLLLGPVHDRRAARGLHLQPARAARGRRPARLPDRRPRRRADRRDRAVSELARRDRRATVGSWLGHR